MRNFQQFWFEVGIFAPPVALGVYFGLAFSYLIIAAVPSCS